MIPHLAILLKEFKGIPSQCPIHMISSRQRWKHPKGLQQTNRSANGSANGNAGALGMRSAIIMRSRCREHSTARGSLSFSVLFHLTQDLPVLPRLALDLRSSSLGILGSCCYRRAPPHSNNASHENRMHSEVSWARKDKHHEIPLVWDDVNRQVHRGRSGGEAATRSGRGKQQVMV